MDRVGIAAKLEVFFFEVNIQLSFVVFMASFKVKLDINKAEY